MSWIEAIDRRIVQLVRALRWHRRGYLFESSCVNQKEPEFTSPVSSKRFMVSWDFKGRALHLVDFDRSRAIASLKSGEPVILVWFNRIHQQVASRFRCLAVSRFFKSTCLAGIRLWLSFCDKTLLWLGDCTHWSWYAFLCSHPITCTISQKRDWWFSSQS